MASAHRRCADVGGVERIPRPDGGPRPSLPDRPRRGYLHGRVPEALPRLPAPTETAWHASRSRELVREVPAPASTRRPSHDAEAAVRDISRKIALSFLARPFVRGPSQAVEPMDGGEFGGAASPPDAARRLQSGLVAELGLPVRRLRSRGHRLSGRSEAPDSRHPRGGIPAASAAGPLVC